MILLETVILNVGLQISLMHYSKYKPLKTFLTVVIGCKQDMPTRFLQKIFKHFTFCFEIKRLHYGIYSNNAPLLLTLKVLKWHKTILLSKGKKFVYDMACTEKNAK